MNNVEVLTNFDIALKPAKVEFDAEKFKEEVNNLVSAYSDLDFESSNIKEIKELRTSINKVSKRLEDERKKIKSEITRPYDEFLKGYNQGISVLTDLQGKFKKFVDDYTENQKAVRYDVVKNWFSEKAKEAMLNQEVFEQYISDFLKEGDFKKDSFTLKKTTIDKLEAIVVDEINKQNQRDADIALITDETNKNNLGPAVYVRYYNDGASLAEILNTIKKDKEEADKAQELIKAKQEQLKHVSKQQNHDEKIIAVDSETGEIVEPKKYETTVKFVMTVEQAKKFKDFLETENIMFETIENMKEVING